MIKSFIVLLLSLSTLSVFTKSSVVVDDKLIEKFNAKYKGGVLSIYFPTYIVVNPLMSKS